MPYWRSGTDAVMVAAERVRAALESTPTPFQDGHQVSVTFGFGVAMAQIYGSNGE